MNRNRIDLSDKVRGKKWRVSIEKLIFNGLSAIEFGPNGIYVPSLQSQLDPAVKSIVAEKKNYVEHWQVVNKMVNEVFRELPLFSNLPESNTNLGSYFPNDKLRKIAEALANYFETIPRRYNLVAKIPGLADLNCTNFRLTSLVSAVECIEIPPVGRVDPHVSGGSSIAHAIRQKIVQKQKNLKNKGGGGFFLNAKIQGFATPDFDNQTVVDGVNRLKQVIFLMIIQEKIEVGAAHTAEGQKGGIFLHDSYAEDLEPEEVKISESLKAFLGRLRLSETRKQSVDQAQKEFRASKNHKPTVLGGVIEPEPYIYLDQKQREIVDSDEGNINAVALKNSLIWGFDSMMNEHDPNMSFIQLSVALEAILGAGSEKTGKTNQLADRCAYLIGRNRVERDKLRNEFIEFYNLRSDLIHGASTRMNLPIKRSRVWADWALRRLLRRELTFGSFDPPSSEQ